ncbi:Hypothetical predicted protein [Cloeon dipterum]|uniref:Poly [ADP-ribose] polymerase n=1 Tax=Cloeon dipterum TaxID=197152 RepID=A0A8S1DIG5_9INSE|nr:Hypothetical predicted protein [Cloeon dipterum]
MEELISSESDYQFVENHMREMMNTNPWNPELTGFIIGKIYRINHPEIWKKYVERKKEIAAEVVDENETFVKELRLYHGSPYVEKIVAEGFRIDESKNGHFGRGIYFAEDSSKSNYYTLGGSGNPCPVHKTYTCGECERKMLLCIVALGKQHVVEKFGSEQANCVTKRNSGYHTLRGAKGRSIDNTEHIIYDQRQVCT